MFNNYELTLGGDSNALQRGLYTQWEKNKWVTLPNRAAGISKGCEKVKKRVDFKLTPEQVKLAEDNHNLIWAFLRKYQLDPEEYYDIAAIGYCKAIARFDGSRGSKLSSFSFLVMYHEYLMHLRVFKGKPMITSYDEEFGFGEVKMPMSELIADPKNYQSEIYADDLLRDAFSILNEKEIKYLKLHLLGTKQRVIANLMGVKQSHVSRKLTKIKQKIENILL